ncbi:universal stress protein [Mucilaginibacter sp. KACC 22773]|uniref:universal stress protein n=1 Tax=Mucilaginibacter sp. KACC 22773 TaxID=3025671 RepID=UPI0023673EDF|nr:universal stress protein [Mucilaginibacter sp. KACC 22773]WDF75585.1 universal stress protein [Mucilaginibacter sp. KACC 22773]
MNTILVPTDFSPCAVNASHYALQLAAGLRAGVHICHAILLPVQTLVANPDAWATADYSHLETASMDALSVTAIEMEHEMARELAPNAGNFKPHVGYSCQMGLVADVVGNIVQERRLSLVVMGMSGAGALSRLFMGSNSRSVIDHAKFPVLLVPPKVKFKPFKKIAFTTDMLAGDIDVLNSVAEIAKYFNAEILIAHITSQDKDAHLDDKQVNKFLSDVTDKINYPKIYYRNIKSADVDQGLDWICKHGQIDMIATVHRRQNFLERIFSGSYTQKLAKHIGMPLLVYPAIAAVK